MAFPVVFHVHRRTPEQRGIFEGSKAPCEYPSPLWFVEAEYKGISRYGEGATEEEARCQAIWRALTFEKVGA